MALDACRVRGSVERSVVLWRAFTGSTQGLHRVYTVVYTIPGIQAYLLGIMGEDAPCLDLSKLACVFVYCPA